MAKKNVLKKKESDSLALTTVEDFFVTGDLAKVTPTQRFNMYLDLCKSLKLNPLTQPFGYISIDGRMCLYSKKDCAEQLRKIHGVSILTLEREWDRDNNILFVNITGKDKNGKVDAATGALHMVYNFNIGAHKKGDALVGQDLANGIMKCETKAKRRLTLSICGLSMPDETEVADIHGAKIEEKIEGATAAQIKKTKDPKNAKKANIVEEAKTTTPATPAGKPTTAPKAPAEPESPMDKIIAGFSPELKSVLVQAGYDTGFKQYRAYKEVHGDVDALKQMAEEKIRHKK